MWAMIEPILSWVCIIALGAWILYAGLVRPVISPPKTTSQYGGISYTTNISPFSCARIPAPQQQTPIINKVINAISKTSH